MKNTIKKIAALSVFAAAAGMTQSTYADVKISDNPESPQSFQICTAVENTWDQINASFDYDSGLTAPSGNDSKFHYNPDHPEIGMRVFWNTFSNIYPDQNHNASRCLTVDASNYYFDDDAAPGLYKIGITSFGVYSAEDEMSTPLWSFEQDPNDPRPAPNPLFEYYPNEEIGNFYYEVVFELSNITDGNNQITGKKARLAYITNKDGEKVDALDFRVKKIYPNQDITISKTVQGNAADENKYFTFVVNVSGEEGADYTVYGADANSGSDAVCVANTDCTIKLKNGQSVRIGYDGTNKQIPVGSVYTITETEEDGYTTRVSLGEYDSPATSNTTGQQTISP